MRALILLAPVTLAACFPWSAMPNDRPDPILRKLSEATIIDMNPNLYKQAGLCPGMEGKLYVTATVQWPGSKPVSRTLGSDVDSLNPADFTVTGPLIKGDANAHLFPDPDVLASVETGFDATIVYKPNPQQFSFQEKFPPEYSCYYGWFEDGTSGGPGDSGESGDSTSDEGKSGGDGGQGGQGGRGDPGGRVTAYVTIVSTPFYPRLIAVLANNRFFLAPADRALGFGAAGGNGGSGGPGGSGGNGGRQKTKEVKTFNDEGEENGTVTTGIGAGGNGGDGGAGGEGGPGGNGGIVEVYYDAAFPELAQLIATDVHGGSPGGGGSGGYAGSAGGTSAHDDADGGADGAGGPGGPDGSVEGSQGRATVRASNVAAKFRGLRGITLSGSGGGQPPRKPKGR